ncbi:MAG: hypothetical protein RR232_00245 [Clostridia bacterium]
MKVKIKHPVFDSIKAIFKLFKKRPDIIDLNSAPVSSGIFIANHSAAGGPFTYELYFPRSIVPWGTHEMCGNYMERWHYLYDVFYRQKLGFGKIKAFVIATSFALVSKMLYDGAELIPTYRDLRFKTTIKRSIEALSAGKSVLIFPENSIDGYHEVLTELHSGFLTLAKRFFEQTGTDVPIYPVYFSNKRNRMIIDRPFFLGALMCEHGSGDRRHITELLRDRMNELNRRYVLHA